MIHGFLSSSQYFRRAVEDLQQDFTVVTVDLLGHGASPASDNYSINGQIDALRTTLESLDLPKPYFIVAHSMGTLIALEYTRQFPAHVDRLVLLNPPIFTSVDEAKASITSTGRFYRAMFFSRYRRLLWRLFKITPRRLHRRRKVLSFADMLRVPHQARDQSLRAIIMPSNFLATIETLDVPSLVIAGQRDREIYSENLKTWRPPDHVTLRINPHGHHFLIFRPREALTEIRQFLGR